MKIPALKISLVFLSFAIAGCSLFKSQPKGSVFSFDYEGKTYQIVGYNEIEGESANFLIYREDDTVLFRVIDRNQTGTLNDVLSGDISLSEANRIYQAGITIAMEQEQYREKDRQRSFETEMEEYRAIIESYVKNWETPRNRLVIYDLNWRLIGIFWDENSNGIVDTVDYGDMEIGTAQSLYETALNRAGSQGRLDKNDSNTFIISRAASGKSDRRLSSNN